MAKLTAHVAGWLYIPIAAVRDLGELTEELTVKPRTFRKKGEAKPPPKRIPVFSRARKGYIGVPIDWGFSYLPDSVPIEDNTSRGFKITAPRMPDPTHPRAPKGQGKFIKALHNACLLNHTVLAVAGTGTGKTVTALAVGLMLGRTMVVCVHLRELVKQWRDEIKDKLGLKDSDIGYVQGAKCDYKGKKIVIAMMPSLAQRRYSSEFYSYFGMAIWDEVHKVGTTMLSKTLGLFNAAVKVALTATEVRRDGGHEIYMKYFGGVRVRSMQKPMPMDYIPVPYKAKGKIWGKSREALVMCISRDKTRNRMCAYYLNRMYQEGRAVLALGERIEHVEAVLRILEKVYRIPDEHIGQFTNQHADEVTGKRRKTSAEYLAWVKEHAEVIGATYGMMTEGVDIPRLSGGVDISPRAMAKQAVGRIRRTLPGKHKIAKWYTPVDMRIKRFRQAYESRCKELASDKNVRIVPL